MWSHISGSKSKAPEVPDLILPSEVTQTDSDGNEVTITKPGNEADHKVAKEAFQKWEDADLEIKALIFMAVPNSHYQFVHPCKTAAQAWDTLRLMFWSVNAEKAIALKRRINLAMCKPDEDVRKWCDKQHKRYINLSRMDPSKMTEKEFCETILDQQDRSDRNWATRVRTVSDMVKSYLAKYRVYPSSLLVTQWLKHEYWSLYKSPDDRNSDSEEEEELNVNSASYYPNNNGGNKRPRSNSVDPNNHGRNKRAKGVKRTDVECQNQFCKRVGHETEICFSYGGPKQGQYPWWWKGPWNLHLHPSKRSAANNIRPQSHAEGGNGTSSGAPSGPSRSLANRISTDSITDADVHNTLSYSANNYDSRAYYPDQGVHEYSANQMDIVGGVRISDGLSIDSGVPEVIRCNASALDASKPVLEACIHDSGANRHVFHSRESFKEYKEIEPVRVNGFGKDLNTCAVGIGTVHVEAWREGGKKVLYELTNCIHVPSARYNLISQAQLDRAGAAAVVGNGKITIHQQGLILLDGRLGSNLMYQLNMWPVPQIVDDDRKLEALIHAFTLETLDDALKADKIKLREDFITASLGI